MGRIETIAKTADSKRRQREPVATGRVAFDGKVLVTGLVTAHLTAIKKDVRATASAGRGETAVLAGLRA